jgi:predicted lactoylglutathione lyase
MSNALTIALPTADRATTYRFYQEALGLEAPGELADDGVPEPLLFVVNDGARVMFIPHGGFGWVTGGRAMAQAGTVECLLSLGVDTDEDVDAVLARVRDAGGEVVSEPEQKPWGYTGTLADPDGHLWEVIRLPG